MVAKTEREVKESGGAASLRRSILAGERARAAYDKPADPTGSEGPAGNVLDAIAHQERRAKAAPRRAAAYAKIDEARAALEKAPKPASPRHTTLEEEDAEEEAKRRIYKPEEPGV